MKKTKQNTHTRSERHEKKLAKKRKKEDQEDNTIEHQSERLTHIWVYNELHVVSC
jgi:hypothetical protein